MAMSDFVPHPMKVYGEQIDEVPRDLYIPPEALQIYLESFEGPLDLLLYLIRKAKFNVLDIPMAALTRQYLEYVELMRERNLNLAAEYLVMAAMMIDIKCRMLLPRTAVEVIDVDPEDDPRAALVRRLLHYEQIQKAAWRLQESPQADRDFYWASSEVLFEEKLVQPEVNPNDLVLIWHELLTRLKQRAHFEIDREPLSLREQMSHVLKRLQTEEGRFVNFFELFETPSTMHWVMGFIAVLELAKQGLVDIEQAEIGGALPSDDNPTSKLVSTLYVRVCLVSSTHSEIISHVNE